MVISTAPSAGTAFTTPAAYDRHHAGGQCLKPTAVGLVVALRTRLTWSIPVRVPTAVDVFGTPVEWVEVDPELAGVISLDDTFAELPLGQD